MESIDREKEQRVWRRVQGAGEPVAPVQSGAPTPDGLLLEVLTDVTVLRQLAGRMGEPAASQLRQLAKQLQTHAAALRGICRLWDIPFPTQSSAPAQSGNPDAALRRCMVRLLRRHQDFIRLCGHGEFGPLYQELADQTRPCALHLARIMGK